MAYEITAHDDFLEVRLSGETSKYEIIEIVGRLARLDPLKSRPDLWILAPEIHVPFTDLVQIAEAIGKKVPPEAAGSKTAYVVADEFQRAKLELYISEAAILTFDMRTFGSRDDAVAWMRSD